MSKWNLVEEFLNAHPLYSANIETCNTTNGRRYSLVLWGDDTSPVYMACGNTPDEAIVNTLEKVRK